MDKDICIVARTIIANNVEELVVSYEPEVTYRPCQPEFFGSSEVTVIFVSGKPAVVETIARLVNARYDTDEARAFKFYGEKK